MDGGDPNNNNEGNDGGQGGDEDSVNSINPDDVGYLPADHVRLNFDFRIKMLFIAPHDKTSKRIDQTIN
jgi:hypothetical protein